MENEKIKKLVHKYLRGECSDEEKQILETWYNQQVSKEAISDEINYQFLEQHIWNKLDLEESKKIRKIKYIPFVAAALALMVSFSAIYMFVVKYNFKSQEIVIVPGSSAAKLSFSDGTEIDLNELTNGERIAIGHVNLYKNKDGELIYKAKESKENLFSVLETPKGGQYQIELTDGTKAWLNATSSIKFPSNFGKNERLVEITGEVYFEVVKDSRRPFKVKTTGQLIEVLGTHFNVNAYHDEPNQVTTLLEGAVKIDAFRKSYLLKPSQQLNLHPNGKVSVSDVLAEEAIAWKNGVFQFSDENVSSIMRKLSRWYNVEVVFDERFVDKRLAGSISRYEDVSKVLEMLELTNTVHFKIEGRRIIVM